MWKALKDNCWRQRKHDEKSEEERRGKGIREADFFINASKQKPDKTRVHVHIYTIYWGSQ